MVTSRAQFAATLQATLVVLQAMIAVGFVGIVALEPDSGYVIPFIAMNGYLLALLGAALVHFRREHAALMQQQRAPRPSLEQRWLNLERLAGHPWLFALLGAGPTPESLGRRGGALLCTGLLVSTMALIAQTTLTY